jgi:hypothetical protein
MKNQWIEKHKRIKELPKTGFKAHQGFASKIITDYAKRYRQRITNKLAAKERGEDYDPKKEYVTLNPDQLDNEINKLGETGDIRKFM